jgi:hypothetical protein
MYNRIYKSRDLIIFNNYFKFIQKKKFICDICIILTFVDYY